MSEYPDEQYENMLSGSGSGRVSRKDSQKISGIKRRASLRRMRRATIPEADAPKNRRRPSELRGSCNKSRAGNSAALSCYPYLDMPPLFCCPMPSFDAPPCFMLLFMPLEPLVIPLLLFMPPFESGRSTAAPVLVVPG